MSCDSIKSFALNSPGRHRLAPSGERASGFQTLEEIISTAGLSTSFKHCTKGSECFYQVFLFLFLFFFFFPPAPPRLWAQKEHTRQNNMHTPSFCPSCSALVLAI